MIKKITLILTLVLSSIAIAQVDYSNNWEDLFSYNTVKKIVASDDTIFALCDNAVFKYNIQTKAIEKLSSINGLSGEPTSAIYYHKKTKRLVIGYESGRLEIIDDNGKITIAPDIINFNQTGLKQINAIYEYNNKLYLATAFAIVIYDIENLEFGDTIFIGKGSSATNVTSLTILDDQIYASTKNGILVANINGSNLVDSNNWVLKQEGTFSNLITFNNAVYASTNNNLIKISETDTLVVSSFSENIVNLKSDNENLIVITSKKLSLLNNKLSITKTITNNSKFEFTLNSAHKKNNTIFLATQKYGLLAQQLTDNSFREIHPEGPLYNDIFSIDVYNNKLWAVYGGYGNVYQPLGIKKGYSYYDGNKWLNTPFDKENPFTDLNSITIDKKNPNTVYIGSMGYSTDSESKFSGGLLKIVDHKVSQVFNHNNSSIRYISSVYPNATTVRVTGTAFDDNGNLWIANVGADDRIKKMSAKGYWNSFNISAIYNTNAFGMNEIAIDQTNTLWIGTRQNGVYVFNEKGKRKLSLSSEPSKGKLPNLTVKTIAADHHDRIWIGTISGLVVYYNASSVFNQKVYKAEPVVILDGDIPQKLLGDQTINTIAIDGADNKWFGTNNSGVLFTNSDGQKTLARFDMNNSPLPSNKIVKIKVDNLTGKVYIATDKGMVVYNSNVAPFGDKIPEVYAYPNPVLKKHKTVTIDGRKGTHLPRNTNIKILDTEGKLVYETNITENQQLLGGKVIWDKRNLAGVKVASGIYVVLLSSEDGSESTSTKIAIIN